MNSKGLDAEALDLISMRCSNMKGKTRAMHSLMCLILSEL
jgi:hypothetical protein